MRCWRPFSVVLALLSGCFTSNSGPPPAGEAPGGSTPAQEPLPWMGCKPTAVPVGPAPDAVDGASREWIHGGRSLFFIAESPGGGHGLWTSSSTQGAGTTLLKRFDPGPTGMGLSGLTRVGERVFFAAGDVEHGSELWVSDGTEAGTRLVKDLWPGATGSFPRSLFEFNGLLYFTASSPEYGPELWRSDGTPEGTSLVVDLEPGLEGSSPDRLTRGGDGSLYFTAHLQDFFTVLMRSEGGSGAVELLRGSEEATILESLTPVGRHLYFLAGGVHDEGAALMVTDGGAPVHLGMFMGAGNLVGLGGKLYFTAAAGEGSHDMALWHSDGTPQGTRRVKVLSGPEGASPSGLTVLGPRLFFAADDGVHGSELWVSDGTAAGTGLFVDLAPGAVGSSPEGLKALQGNLLFFSADLSGHGREPWVSNGTPGGTRALNELVPGPAPSDPRGFVRSGWDVFFTGEGGLGGRRLWAVPLRTDPRCREQPR